MAPLVKPPTEAEIEQYKNEKHSAFVIGYTGETGKALVSALNERKLFKNVVLIGRRKTEINVGPEFEQKVINFDNADEHKQAVQGCDVGFCCLGTTRAVAGKEGFVKVDRDYVLYNAEAAKAEGCKSYCVVTSGGSSSKSSFLYPKTKGQVEDATKDMKFDRLHIIRPGLIMVDRQQSRPGESIMRCVMKPFIWAFSERGVYCISARLIGQAMINTAIAAATRSGPTPEVLTLENKDLHDVLGGYK